MREVKNVFKECVKDYVDFMAKYSMYNLHF